MTRSRLSFPEVSSGSRRSAKDRLTFDAGMESAAATCFPVQAFVFHEFGERPGFFHGFEIFTQQVLDQLLFEDLRRDQFLFVEIAFDWRQPGVFRTTRSHWPRERS